MRQGRLVFRAMSLLIVLLAAAAPQPAELKTFRDWTVGCDNGRACHAVALMPEKWPEDGATMSIRRGAGANDLPVIAFDKGEGPGIRLRADGRALGGALRVGEAGPEVAPEGVAEALGVIRSAARLELVGPDGTRIGTVSLAGATAALLYMDEQQKRTGTETALVRPGARRASAVPPPPALPTVTAAPAGGKAAPKLTAARIKALRRQAQCEINEVGGPDTYEISAIGPSHSLLLLTCGAGAYNVSYVPYLLTGSGKAMQAKAAHFDLPPESWEGGTPMLVNAEWDPKQRLLASFAKARGIGDCGMGRSYAWDGARFRLVEQVQMDECRGSTDYITTWRAEVRRR